MWLPDKMHWRFQKFYEPVLPFTTAQAGASDPPEWSQSFNTLRKGEDAFFVRYPAPEIVTLIFDTDDERFNDRSMT